MSLHVRFVAAFIAWCICGSPGGRGQDDPPATGKPRPSLQSILYSSMIWYFKWKFVKIRYKQSLYTQQLVQGDPLATGKPTTLEHVHCQLHNLKSTNQRKYHPDALFYNCSACVIVKALATRHFVCSFEESVQCDNKWKQCKHLFICIVYKKIK